MAFNTQEQNIIQWGLQNGKSKDEVKQAISNYRLGIKPEPKPVENQPAPSFTERIKAGINEKGETIANTLEDNTKTPLERGISATATGFSALSGTLYNALPEGARNTLDKIGGGIGQGVNYLADKISNNPALQEFAMSEAGKDTERVSRVLADLGIISGEILGVDQATKALTKGAGMVEQGLNKTGETLTTGTEKVLTGAEKLLPKSEDIMTKVARITPKEAQTFKQMTGKSTGEYLAQKGNFNSPEKIVSTEAETFAKTLADKEATLAKLEGNFKSGVVDDVLKSLKQKAVETSTKNVKAPYLKQVDAWLKKAKDTGLTMEEINQAKKLFEREVKLGYNKLTDATKVKQATYLDDALREFQDETASSLGFTNIRDLSKQIQASKFIVDKLGNKIVSNDLLNGVSLTDYIILAGGEPTSVGAFLTKKLFSSKALQAKLAEKIYTGKVKSPVKANYSPQATKATQTKNSITNNIPKSSPKSATKSSLKGKGVIPETNLINEAKKYKSAEEFVSKQNALYHGSDSADIIRTEGFKLGGVSERSVGASSNVDRLGKGIYFADDANEAARYARSWDTKDVVESFVKPGVKIKEFPDYQSWYDFVESKNPKAFEKPELLNPLFEKEGFDGVKLAGDIVIFDPKNVLTKSQLEEIWKKANSKANKK